MEEGKLRCIECDDLYDPQKQDCRCPHELLNGGATLCELESDMVK